MVTIPPLNILPLIQKFLSHPKPPQFTNSCPCLPHPTTPVPASKHQNNSCPRALVLSANQATTCETCPSLASANEITVCHRNPDEKKKSALRPRTPKNRKYRLKTLLLPREQPLSQQNSSTQSKTLHCTRCKGKNAQWNALRS